MSFLLNFISFILLFFSINSSTLKDRDEVSLIYYEYDYNLSEINLTMINRDISIMDLTACHLAFIKNEKDEHDEIFNFYSVYFNRQWIFFSNNTETIDKLLKIDYDSKDIYLIGILIPKTLEYKIKKDHGIPIFEIDDNYTEYMEKWDMRHSDKNIYFSLQINHAVEYYPENYFLILSFILLTLSFTLLMFWRIRMSKLDPIHILPMHKVGKFLLYLGNILCFILLFKSINIRGEKIYDEQSESSILLDTALITMNGIHRTILWFFVLILSYGWNISLQQLNARDCKFFLKIILVIFFILSIDQIIDVIFEPIYRIHVSEIKNGIFYLLMIYTMLYKIDKNINFLKLKIHFAAVISPQYINALNYKIKLFNKFKIIIIAYYLLYLIILILQKSAFYEHDEIIFESYNYLALDCIFEFAFLILFRPKELPENYNINLGDNLDGDDGNIYQYKLPNYSEAHLLIKDLTKKQVDECKKNKTPIVIVGPNVKNINNEPNNISNENNDNNSTINNYFAHLNIGIVDNQK